MKCQYVALQKIIPLLLVFFLSACGFHLRGMVNSIPEWLNNIAIMSKNNDKQLVSILQSQLEGYKIQVNTEPSLAQYWLIVDDINLQQQIISIGASTNPRQYTITLTIGFVLQTRKGQIVKTPSKITVARQLTLNNDRILGSKDEESILIGEMKQDAAAQIINQLSHVEKVIESGHENKAITQ